VSVRIALLGDRNPALPSHRELDAVRSMLGEHVSAEWVGTDSDRAAAMADFDGIWLVPGSPYADDNAVYDAVRWARGEFVRCAGARMAAA
jgi:hypothetical protein